MGEWSAARPGRTLSPGKTRDPFYRRLGGPQGRSGRAENLVPTGIRSPDRPARSQSIPTELPGSQQCRPYIMLSVLLEGRFSKSGIQIYFHTHERKVRNSPQNLQCRISISILIDIRLVISDATYAKRQHNLRRISCSFYVPGAKNVQTDTMFLVVLEDYCAL